MDNSNTLWQTKLHARLHDPAEKALVLLRDPDGHEGGSARVLHRLLGFQRLDEAASTLPADPDNADALHTTLFHNGIPRDIYETVRRADWWAAAADRPQWPLNEITVATRGGDTRTFAKADFAQVRWTKKPVLVHPLTGEQLDLAQRGDFTGTELDDLKSRSFEHIARLIRREAAGEPQWFRTLLALWRFGPELSEDEDGGKLGALWPLLPADTRVPDHSIWDHLDLTSAFAGAFAADPQGDAALLALSIGPVQSFIEAARSTSDLWAGSHLLARLSWEAMRVVCERLGPDAILFPKLRGVPQVDLWLRDQCGLQASLFDACSWAQPHNNHDGNPLFAAALPNRFVAVVPASQAADIAQAVQAGVRQWLQGLGQQVVNELLKAADLQPTEASQELPCHEQMRVQLQGFPEVHWAAVPFSLIRTRNAERQTDLDTSALQSAMAPFFGVAPNQPAGFLASPAWKTLHEALQWADGTTFFAPNPGALYPAVFDLAERLLAAAKAVRPFEQTRQEGWRCALSGEAEWLTTDRQQLGRSYRDNDRTLWARVAARRPAWARPGEHLAALPAVKRVWPALFAREVGRALSEDQDSARRFVVSTHTMALAHQIRTWAERGAPPHAGLERLTRDLDPAPTALPRSLGKSLRRLGPTALQAARWPSLLEDAPEDQRPTAERALREVLSDGKALETYYGLLLMDGDRMGAWLSGEQAISYLQSFHPQVRAGFEREAERQPKLKAYAAQGRALSPNRHLAISAALNDFSLHVAPHVIEEEHLGRLIYAGGDDVLALLPVADLLPAMQRLRDAYAGTAGEARNSAQRLRLSKGFAWLDGRLMRMMGEHATSSCGAVVAHHQAPLAAVLRELRSAERRAKDQGGRDAFSLTVIKRSGGALQLTARYGRPLQALVATRDFLGGDGVSRRAVYNTLEWLHDLPLRDGPGALASMLAFQFNRQCEVGKAPATLPDLCQELAELTLQPLHGLSWLENLLSVAEFLARGTRGDA